MTIEEVLDVIKKALAEHVRKLTVEGLFKVLDVLDRVKKLEDSK